MIFYILFIVFGVTIFTRAQTTIRYCLSRSFLTKRDQSYLIICAHLVHKCRCCLHNVNHTVRIIIHHTPGSISSKHHIDWTCLHCPSVPFESNSNINGLVYPNGQRSYRCWHTQVRIILPGDGNDFLSAIPGCNHITMSCCRCIVAGVSW